ncbi:hypothetical protein GEMRC1_006165 [Eukaryota sp. GEM-RC1]
MESLSLILSYSTVAFIGLLLLSFLGVLIKQRINLDLLSNINGLTFALFVFSLSISLGTIISFWISVDIFSTFKILLFSVPIVCYTGVRSFKG